MGGEVVSEIPADGAKNIKKRTARPYKGICKNQSYVLVILYSLFARISPRANRFVFLHCNRPLQFRNVGWVNAVLCNMHRFFLAVQNRNHFFRDRWQFRANVIGLF